MTCECVKCNKCGGKGWHWKDVVKNRTMKSLVKSCQDCDGAGIIRLCRECRDKTKEIKL